MTKIITTTDVQQKIGEISESIATNSFIVTNRGRGRIVMLPYFDGCNSVIDEYMENYEMMLNKEKLQKEFKRSMESGLSSLTI